MEALFFQRYRLRFFTGVERAAAAQVTAVWNQANAIKASTTNGFFGESSVKFYSSDQVMAANKAGIPLNQSEFGQGYATGGSFLVGGSGGTDTTPVGFMATPGERVTIETPEQQRAASGGVTININGSSLSTSQMIAAIQQALRVNPALFSPSFSRPG